MAFDETLRPYSRFDEVEVFALTGKAEEVRELRPSNFAGPIAQWAEQRMHNFGETIVPRHVYIEPAPAGDHRVAWVYHDGIDTETGQSFCMHHVVCDCSLEAEALTSPEERERLLGDCDALANVLRKRAYLVNATYGVANILERMYDPERLAFEQSVDTQAFIESTMLYLLEHDYRHPESWVANVESGWNLISMMANILGIRIEDTGWYAQELAGQNAIQTDGMVVALAPKVQAEIDAEYLLRGLDDSLAA